MSYNTSKKRKFEGKIIIDWRSKNNRSYTNLTSNPTVGVREKRASSEVLSVNLLCSCEENPESEISSLISLALNIEKTKWLFFGGIKIKN